MGKKFHLGDVLSITDGHLLSPRGMDGVYDILDYMTGDRLYTHALIRAVEFCGPYLLGQYPFLTDVKMPDELTNNIEGSLKWLATQISVYGEMFEVEPLAEGEWTSIDPVEELIGMVGADKVIIVEIAGDENRTEGN